MVAEVTRSAFRGDAVSHLSAVSLEQRRPWFAFPSKKVFFGRETAAGRSCKGRAIYLTDDLLLRCRQHGALW